MFEKCTNYLPLSRQTTHAPASVSSCHDTRREMKSGRLYYCRTCYQPDTDDNRHCNIVARLELQFEADDVNWALRKLQTTSNIVVTD